MKNRKRTLFVFNIDNTIDLITNSSSELFVINGDSQEQVEEMVKEIYPNYLDEYEKIQNINDLDESSLSLYLSYAYHDWDDKLILSRSFNIKPELLYSNWGDFGKEGYWYPELSNQGENLIKEKLGKNLYFMFSIDDNPNWDKQEELMNIGQRYHLG